MKLNIQKFAVTKSTTFAESNLDATNNTSTLKITVTFSANNQTTYFSSATLKCTCNGVTQSKTVSHPAGGEVKKTFTFNDIQHNADGSKTVSWNWSCATGTSVLGTVSASGTRTLATLHTPPVLNSVSFTETEPSLLNIGLSNDVFVLGLSKKQYTINANYYDDARYSRLTVINRYGLKISDQQYVFPTQNIDVLNTNNDILDLSVVELRPYIDRTTTPNIDKLNLKYKLYDTKNGTAETQYLDYSYLTYKNLTLTASAKRVGQTSGQVSISCNGDFFNGEIGNINQSSSYKPTIKYKYWKYEDTEPVSYNNTVSTGNITISGSTFTISSLNIGSTTETDNNYFDPRYSYRIKIQVSDNFTTIESPELLIPVGEATWTEFRNYVDFKAITIQHEPIITIEEYEEYTGEVTSSSNKALTYNIVKTGYTPIGIVGVLASGTRSSYINIYAFSISNDGTEGNVNIKNTHGSSSLVANDTQVKIYVAYIRS